MSATSTGSCPPGIEQAELDWTEAGEPVSRRHNDLYFSREDGLAESEYVFIGGNNLPERFSALTGTATQFVVGETGFGTGLNFLASVRLWLSSASREGQVLHYVSLERYPLARADLERALRRWPELAPWATELLERYPAPTQGTHRLVLFGGRVRLTLFWGEALEGLERLDFQADAWFLDGFAPAKNADLWQSRLLNAIAQHSGPGSTLSTFTAVGAVRRNLQALGFVMEKVPGFGQKREMLRGRLPHTIAPSTGPLFIPRSVLIVGAGLAGCLSALSLASRGFNVTLLEAGPTPAQGASGNSQGALYTKLGVDFNVQTRLALSGLLFSQRLYQHWPYSQPTTPFWHPTGLIQLAWNERERLRQTKFLARNDYPAAVLQPVDASQASDLAGTRLDQGGLWFPRSGWVCPPQLCAQALKHPRINVYFNVPVKHINTDKSGHWLVQTGDGVHWEADALVLCTGASLTESANQVGVSLPIKAIRGQVSQLPEQRLPSVKTVLCGEGYLNPAWQGRTLFGASFDLRDPDPGIRMDSHQGNLRRLAEWLPDSGPEDDLHQDVLRQDFLHQNLEGRVSFRATLPDYQPLAGTLSPDHPNLFALGGLGSKGLAMAPLLAEYLADCISRQPPCLEKDAIDRVTPLRFHKQP